MLNRRRLLRAGVALAGAAVAGCAVRAAQPAPQFREIQVGGWDAAPGIGEWGTGVADYNRLVSLLVKAYSSTRHPATFVPGQDANVFSHWYGLHLGDTPKRVLTGPDVFTWVPAMQEPKSALAISASNVAADLTGVLRTANMDLGAFHPGAIRACQVYPFFAVQPVLGALPLLRDPLVLAFHRGRLREAGITPAVWSLPDLPAVCTRVQQAHLPILTPIAPWGDGTHVAAAYIATHGGNTTTANGAAATLTDPGVVAGLRAALTFTPFMPGPGRDGTSLEQGGYAFAFRWLSEVIAARRVYPEMDFVPLPPGPRPVTAVTAVGLAMPRGHPDPESAASFMLFAVGPHGNAALWAEQGYGLPAASRVPDTVLERLGDFTGTESLLEHPQDEIAPMDYLGGGVGRTVIPGYVSQVLNQFFGRAPQGDQLERALAGVQPHAQEYEAHNLQVFLDRQTHG